MPLPAKRRRASLCQLALIGASPCRYGTMVQQRQAAFRDLARYLGHVFLLDARAVLHQLAHARASPGVNTTSPLAMASSGVASVRLRQVALQERAGLAPTGSATRALRPHGRSNAASPSAGRLVQQDRHRRRLGQRARPAAATTCWPASRASPDLRPPRRRRSPSRRRYSVRPRRASTAAFRPRAWRGGFLVSSSGAPVLEKGLEGGDGLSHVVGADVQVGHQARVRADRGADAAALEVRAQRPRTRLRGIST